MENTTMAISATVLGEKRTTTNRFAWFERFHHVRLKRKNRIDGRCRGVNQLGQIGHRSSLIKTANSTQRLVAEFQPEQIWLFDSHAWGTSTEDSDVDLMVVVDW